jgi:hypothetical protein
VPNSTFAPVAVPNAGSRSMCGSITGTGWRADRRANSTSRMTAAVTDPSTRADAHPQSSASTSARASAPIATLKIAAPTVSGRPASLPAAGAGGSTRTLAISAIAATGTFTRNTHRQLAATSAPPSTGPSAAAAPPTDVQPRIAPVRLSGGAAASSRPSEAGISSAPPAAWTTRAATSTQTLPAAAQAAEASANTTTPARNAARRPIRSAARPAGTSSAANTIA